jgi:REP element-mobilizing transposase RayT
MSLARPILPGRVYLITRRCTQRQFLLRPDEKTNQACLYCLGEAAQRFGIELIGWLAMSNHYHAVVHDPHGRLPDFACHFHQMLAKCLNARWSRWENLWSTEPPTYTVLIDPADVFDKLLYALLNPVVDHLVDSVGHWPGASSWSQLDGREVRVERPSFFFRRDGVMPAAIALKTTVPPGIADELADFGARVREAVSAHEREVRARRLARREPLLGRKGVLATSAFDRPKTPSPRGGLRPFIACRNLWRRICALDALERFRAAYREARLTFVGGLRDVVFPAGTFALRRLGVECDAPA